jgi:hypothetical protein
VDVSFSGLTPAAPLDGTEIVPVIQSGGKRTTTGDIAALAGGGGAVSSVNGRTGTVTGLAEDSAVVHDTGNETILGVKTFDESTGAGAIHTRHMTVLPNPGRSSSASIFMDNENGQTWEFYNNSSGSFGIYNGTAGNQPVTVQSDAMNGGLTVDQYGLITNGRFYVNGTVQNVTDGTGAKDAVNRTQLDTGGWVSAPATATSTGVAGQKAYDSGFMYICVATNTWKRTLLTTF